MWNSEIRGKNIEQGILSVNVLFKDGAESFNEIFSMRNGADLNGNIKSRLDQLNTLQDFHDAIELGPYTPTDPIPDEDPRIKIGKLRELKEYVDLGLIKDTDPELQAALTDAKESLK